MLLLMINLLVFAAVAAAAFRYACVPGEEGEEGAGVDYRKLHALWAVQGQARDWDSLRDQVRRWHEIAVPGCAPSVTEQVARDLNAAVFRFAVPGAPLTFNAASPAREHSPCPALRRARAARWPL